MFNRLIVAFDGSEPSRRALAVGLELGKRLQMPVHTITVIEGIPEYVTAAAYEPIDPSVVQLLVDQRDAATTSLIDEVRRLGSEAGVEIVPEAVVADEVNGIVDAIRKHCCDLLIVGLRHHPGLIDRLTAHTTQSLTERAPCSVLGVR